MRFVREVIELKLLSVADVKGQEIITSFCFV